MVKKENENHTKMDSCDWYSFLAETFGMIPLHMGGSAATEQLLEMCQLNENSWVLDVGCGSGYTVCKIAKNYGSKVIGIDINEKQISKAKESVRKQKLEDKVEFRVASVLELPFDKETFDVVIFESVLTPLEDNREEALKEMVRVLRANGRIGANEGAFSQSTSPEVLKNLEGGWGGSSFLTFDSLRKLFEDSGLNIIQMVEGKEKLNIVGELGLRGILAFMVRRYPKLLWRLITDSKLREAQKKDAELNKAFSEHGGGYILIVGQKIE
ncbi:MAG: class I SAM-dependent methyltransferase [Candidatus Hermodarchaeota archaeon]